MIPRFNIKRAVIHANTSGNNTIVAAVTGKCITVLALHMSAAGALTATFQSDASGTPITGSLTMATGLPHVLPFCEAGWFSTAAGKLLNLALSAGTYVDGELLYVEE